MNTLLKKKTPFPKHYTYDIYDSLVSTVLVFICLIAFKPSFISEISFQNQLIISGIISLVVALVTFGKCAVVAKMERSGKWTFKMDLITLFVVLFTITTILLALSPLVLKSWLKLPISIDGKFVLILFGFVYLIGIFLFFVSISARYIINGSPDQSLADQNATKIEEIEESPISESVEIILEGKNQGERMVIQKENLISISTNGHYVDIFLVDPQKGESKKVVFRNSIVSITNSLKEHDEFIQCHRSHLINLNHVDNLLGSSKKMEIRFKNLDLKIPVSRTKASILVERLKTRKK